MKKSLILFIFIFPLFFNSCITVTMNDIRNKIIINNPDVTAVGIILDYTNSDYRYIALELKLNDNKTLFLSFVNYMKFPDKAPFYLRRFGNYSFAAIHHFVRKETNESDMVLSTMRYNLPYLSKKIGIQMNTMSDLIKYYDNINVFVESLPLVNEDNYQRMVEEGKLVKAISYEQEFNFVTEYYVKTIWNDKYYGYEQERINGYRRGKLQQRKPDYDNDEVVIGPFHYLYWNYGNRSKNLMDNIF